MKNSKVPQRYFGTQLQKITTQQLNLITYKHCINSTSHENKVHHLPPTLQVFSSLGQMMWFLLKFYSS